MKFPKIWGDVGRAAQPKAQSRALDRLNVPYIKTIEQGAVTRKKGAFKEIEIAGEEALPRLWAYHANLPPGTNGHDPRVMRGNWVPWSDVVYSFDGPTFVLAEGFADSYLLLPGTGEAYVGDNYVVRSWAQTLLSSPVGIDVTLYQWLSMHRADRAVRERLFTTSGDEWKAESARKSVSFAQNGLFYYRNDLNSSAPPPEEPYTMVLNDNAGIAASGWAGALRRYSFAVGVHVLELSTDPELEGYQSAAPMVLVGSTGDRSLTLLDSMPNEGVSCRYAFSGVFATGRGELKALAWAYLADYSGPTLADAVYVVDHLYLLTSTDHGFTWTRETVTDLNAYSYGSNHPGNDFKQRATMVTWAQLFYAGEDDGEPVIMAMVPALFKELRPYENPNETNPQVVVYEAGLFRVNGGSFTRVAWPFDDHTNGAWGLFRSVSTISDGNPFANGNAIFTPDSTCMLRGGGRHICFGNGCFALVLWELDPESELFDPAASVTGQYLVVTYDFGESWQVKSTPPGYGTPYENQVWDGSGPTVLRPYESPEQPGRILFPVVIPRGDTFVYETDGTFSSYRRVRLDPSEAPSARGRGDLLVGGASYVAAPEGGLLIAFPGLLSPMQQRMARDNIINFSGPVWPAFPGKVDEP